MSPTREELAAFADGELGPARTAEIEAVLAVDPALAAEVEAHRALKMRLSAHFAPILEEPLPARLTAALAPPAEVIDFATVRGERAERCGLPRWSWIAGPALAASLVLSLFGPWSGSRGKDYASPQLAAVLDNQLAADQPAAAPTRILLSFRDREGDYCRAFAAAAQSGIACRDARGWRLRSIGDGLVGKSGEYRQAGSEAAGVLVTAQEMAAGPALNASEERTAVRSNWR